MRWREHEDPTETPAQIEIKNVGIKNIKQYQKKDNTTTSKTKHETQKWTSLKVQYSYKGNCVLLNWLSFQKNQLVIYDQSNLVTFQFEEIQSNDSSNKSYSLDQKASTKGGSSVKLSMHKLKGKVVVLLSKYCKIIWSFFHSYLKILQNNLFIFSYI